MATLIVLTTVITAGGLFIRYEVAKSKRDAETRRLADIASRYQGFLESAKSQIRSQQLSAAVECLASAVVMDEVPDKSEAVSLLRQVKIVEAPVGSNIVSLPDTELSNLCKAQTLPPAYHLTDPILNLQYHNKILMACNNELNRRSALAEAERKKKAIWEEAQKKEAEKKEAEHRAALADAAARQQAQMQMMPPAISTDPFDWLQLVNRNGTHMKGKVTECDGNSVVFAFGEPSISKTYAIDQIEDLNLVGADANLMSHIVWGALTCGNGVVAYKVAYFGKEADARLTAVVLDPAFASTAQQVLTQRSRMYSLQKTILTTTAQRKRILEAISVWERYNYAMAHPETWGTQTNNLTSSHSSVCPVCGGRGTLPAQPPMTGTVQCLRCKGSGYITNSRTRQQSVSVPPPTPELAKSLDAYRQELEDVNNKLGGMQADVSRGSGRC